MKRLLTLALFPILSIVACDSTASDIESDSTDSEPEHDATDSEPARDGSPATLAIGESEPAASTPLRAKALGRMRNAAKYFHDNVARRGGYAWHHNASNLNERWGDIQLDVDQIMIQSPGTADVTIAFVEAALADPATPALRTYARDAALALRHGQVKSGGWRLYADFKPAPTLKACYRHTTANCSCGGCKFSVYDDQVTQTALIAMMRTDKLLGFADAAIAESSAWARPRVRKSQFPTHGGFPQGFLDEVVTRPALQASYPPSIGTACGLAHCYANSYTHEYWDDPTLNDNLASAFVEMLYWAREVYPAEATTYQTMLTDFGAFLRRAQMPQPQPAWAQQYDIEMQPRWARNWEAPAIAGRESQDVMWALLRLYQLDPGVPANRDAVGVALAYLETVDHANDTRIHRYIELDDTAPANIGFYTVSPGGYPVQFSPAPPTYQNYGWEDPSQLAALHAEYDRLASDTTAMKRSCQQLRADTANAVDTAVNNERWITTYGPGGPRSGATPGDYLDTATFVRNMRTLAEFVARTTTDCVAWNY